MSCLAPTKLAHVVYRTRRFDEMLAWYRTVFSTKVQYASPALAFLTFDDEHHRFAFVNLAVFQPEGSELDRQGAVGVDHLGYTYPSLRQLLENYALLKEHGITASLYYADPDGNQMEFQVDCLASGQHASAFMESLFALNPIGVEFDPDQWLASLRAGTPESKFLVRRNHEPVSPIRGAISQIVPPR